MAVLSLLFVGGVTMTMTMTREQEGPLSPAPICETTSTFAALLRRNNGVNGLHLSDEEQHRFTFCAWMSELSERQVVCLRNQANLNDKSPIVVRRDDRLRASPYQAHVR